MKCHKLLYKPYRKAAHYEQFLRKEKEKEEKQKKQLFYQQIINFRESRYPLEFLKHLEEKINPFELSLQKLKQLFSQKHPQYSNELVNESVEHIFNRKCQQSEMIKESAIVIEYGDQYIRNGRKLIKEDFSYDFSKFIGNSEDSKINPNDSSKTQTNNPDHFMKSINKSLGKSHFEEKREKSEQGPMTERNPMSSDRFLTNRSRTESPSKIMDLMRKTERFNEILLEQIRRDKLRFENLDEIEEGSANDSIFYNYHQQHNAYTDRSRQNESLNSFRESDLLVRPDTLDTGRSQVQELNFLLSSLNFEEGGQQTRRSKRSQKALRINREIKDQLYNARGGLKLQIVRRAIQKLKKQSNVAGDISSRIHRY